MPIGPLTNNNGISLSAAIWLAHDTYSSGADEHPEQNVISATALLKPTRQIVLAPRVPLKERVLDVTDLIASRFGHAIHDSMEVAWKEGYQDAMKRLGYTQKVIDRVRINPTPGELDEDPDCLPIYLEQRFFRELDVDGNSVIISGKFDQIIIGELNDTKTTSVYSWINKSKDEDYALQGSIYKWIVPDLVSSDVMRIQHVFTDWQSIRARTDKDYPPQRLMEHKVELLSLEKTESFMRNKIREIVKNQNLNEKEIVRCSDEELWKSDPVYKYYTDPAKAAAGGRATKNFPSAMAAGAYRSEKGKGVVVTVPGKVKRCLYCEAAPICTQKDEYELE